MLWRNYKFDVNKQCSATRWTTQYAICYFVFPSGDPAKGGEGSARKFFSLVSAERVAELVETNGVRLRFFNCFAFIQCDDI